MVHRARLGIDLAELADEPTPLYDAAHIAWLAGGGHAGDPSMIARAVERCVARGVAVGAHPGYPDRERFGRVELELSPEALADTVRAQCALVRAIAAERGLAVTMVKLHGALYHRADRDASVARVVLDAVADALGEGLSIAAMDRRETARVARERRWTVLREGFADRATRADGSLVARGEPGAMIERPELAAARARALVAEGGADVLCVHGDGPNALAVARAVRAALDEGAR